MLRFLNRCGGKNCRLVRFVPARRRPACRLKVAAEGLTEESGDPGLDTVLSEIDLRVAVELAKAGIR